MTADRDSQRGMPPADAPPLPYGRQSIDDTDRAAVLEVLSSEWLTTGPKVDQFEQAMAAFVGVRHAVTVSNGTAALHAAAHALHIGPGDEVIVPAITFAATANCVCFQGATPIFCDVDPDTLLLTAETAAAKVTPRTRAIFAVDYAGQPCDYDEIGCLAAQHDLAVVADACHALGGSLRGRPVGSLARLSTFSFHPVKPITTGEGGMITTDDAELAKRMRDFRNHGITTDHRQRAEAGNWSYEMTDLGFNYRLSDLQCALGISQLRRLPSWIERRQRIASQYDRHLADLPGVTPLARRPHCSHGYHLYVVRLVGPGLAEHRNDIFAALRAAGIGVNVHYLPVYLHPYYRRTFGTGPGLCPAAEVAYEQILSLPIFPAMTEADVARVYRALETAVAKIVG